MFFFLFSYFFFIFEFFLFFFKCLAGDTLTQCTTFFTVHLRIIVMIKINPGATLKQLVHVSANTIIIYYLHLKIYLLSSWVRNIAVIPLDIHVICKYTFLCTPHLKKRTTHLFCCCFLGIFFEGVGNRSGSFYIQRSVRSTSCVTINKEKVYNKMAHQLVFLFLFFCFFFLHEHLSRSHRGSKHFSYTPCGRGTSSMLQCDPRIEAGGAGGAGVGGGGLGMGRWDVQVLASDKLRSLRPNVKAGQSSARLHQTNTTLAAPIPPTPPPHPYRRWI